MGQLTWEANGRSLSTKAWDVTTFGGRRYAPAARRGENVVIPFQSGRRHTPKLRDSQLVSLNMWMLAVDPNTGGLDELSEEQQKHANWNELLDIFDVEGQFPLVKKWWDGEDLKVATALAEYRGGLEPSMSSSSLGRFDVDLEMTDPYFYGTLTEPAALPDLVAAEGDVDTSHLWVSLQSNTAAGLRTMRMTFEDGNWIEYKYDQHTGGSAVTVVFDFLNKTAKVGDFYVNGLLRRNPNFMSWPALGPGESIEVTGAVNSSFRYQPAYR